MQFDRSENGNEVCPNFSQTLREELRSEELREDIRCRTPENRWCTFLSVSRLFHIS